MDAVTVTIASRIRTGNCPAADGGLFCRFTPGHKGTHLYASPDRVPPHPLAPVYNWLVQDIGFPINWCSDKPAWLDIRWLAACWHEHDAIGDESAEDYLNMILYETGWEA